MGPAAKVPDAEGGNRARDDAPQLAAALRAANRALLRPVGFGWSVPFEDVVLLPYPLVEMNVPARFTYCPNCGAGLRGVEVAGRSRRSCQACGYVQYQNPVVGVAAVIRNADSHVLFCRKRRSGGWSFPSGYVEWDEDVRDALVREVREELALTIDVGDVIAVHSNFHDRERQTVGVWFHGRITAGELCISDGEVSEARYFAIDDLPVPAYPTDALVIAQLRRS